MRESCPARLSDRLRDVRIAARDDLEVSRHVFHGQPGYVLRDPLTFETHRLSRDDYQIVASLESDASLGEVFQRLCRQGKLTAAREEEFYRFVASLQRLGLLTNPDADGRSLFQRHAERTRSQRRSKWMGFLFLQVPLLNPDRFLERTRFVSSIAFSSWFVALWALAMLVSVALLATRWGDFVAPIDAILSGQTLLIAWGVLIALKALHEFGHGWACKRYGGRVPEMGAYFIVFNPCAYVDASAAWGFPRRWARIVVSLGGVYFESFAAIAALWFWAFSEPSLARAAAHHVVIMATFVTLLFNLNPLLRYDGYFVLCDVVGAPNLRSRSVALVQAYLKRILLGLPLQASQRFSAGNLWMSAYAVAATAYKISIVIAMSMLIALRFPGLGLALASYYVLFTAGTACWRAFKFLWLSKECEDRRLRSALCSAALVGGLVACLAAPAPRFTAASGTLTREHVRTLRTESAGTLEEMAVTAGDRVGQGRLVARLANNELETQAISESAGLEALRIRSRLLAAADEPAEADKTRRRLDYQRRVLGATEEKIAALSVRSRNEGRVLRCLERSERGRFLPPDTAIAQIGWGRRVVTAWSTAEAFVDARLKVGDPVEVRFYAAPSETRTGRVLSLAPASERRIERPELTQLAGGEIVVDPRTGLTEESRFRIEIGFDEPIEAELPDGCRANVRLHRAHQTIAAFAWRRFQQGLQRLDLL